jgi:hypothetical protein
VAWLERDVALYGFVRVADDLLVEVVTNKGAATGQGAAQVLVA